jgi:hypothetical protein
MGFATSKLEVVRRKLRPTANISLALFITAFVIYFFFALFEDNPWSSAIALKNRALASSNQPCPFSNDGENGEVVLLFGGDIMQHRGQMNDDFVKSYIAIASKIREADIAAGNLEFPVYPQKPIGPPAFSARFNGNFSHLQALASAGWDILFTANNHAFDEGIEGFQSTIAQIKKAGMHPVGTARSQLELRSPVIMEVKSIRIAFFAYTYDVNPYFDDGGNKLWPSLNLPIFVLNFDDWSGPWRKLGADLFREHTALAHKAGAQFIVGYCHWGSEWDFLRTPDQQLAARDMIDAGFDLVIGSHPHVIQGSEIYKDRLISYSLGNLNCDFAQWEVRTGGLLEVQLASRPNVHLTRYCYIPIYVDKADHQVVPADYGCGSTATDASRLFLDLLGPVCNRN